MSTLIVVDIAGLMIYDPYDNWDDDNVHKLQLKYLASNFMSVQNVIILINNT